MCRQTVLCRFLYATLPIVLLLLLTVPGVTGNSPEVIGSTTRLPLVLVGELGRGAVADEEMVLIDQDGRVFVVDPYVAHGTTPVNWQSPSLYWTGVVLGDFNGDGDQEILAIRQSRVQVFDPVVHGTAASGQWNLDAPLEWYNIHTGDFDNDGRDEIVMLRTEDGTHGVISRLLVFDGNGQGTAWTRTLNLGHASYWDDMATGDANGDGRDDLGLFRNVDNRLMILSGATSTRLHEDTYGFPWLDLEFVNTHDVVGAEKWEIVLSRQDVITALPSLLVFRWNGGVTLADIYQDFFYPYFTDVEGADLNGDGDEEILMYRESDASVALASRNIAGASMRPFEPAGADSPGTGWQNLKAGDIEGDGRDEVVLLRPSKYRVYNRPEADDHYYEVAGSFKASFAVGDLDG